MMLTMNAMMMKMRVLLWLLCGFAVMGSSRVLAGEKVKQVSEKKGPVVEVYAIGKDAPHTVLEVWNPTGQTFYFRGYQIMHPFRDVEVRRGEKWLVTDLWKVDESQGEVYPLKPGAKMLLSADPPGDDVCRFRFLFYTEREIRKGKVVSAWSRAIDPKELGERHPNQEVFAKDATVMELLTDETLTAMLKAMLKAGEAGEAEGE